MPGSLAFYHEEVCIFVFDKLHKIFDVSAGFDITVMEGVHVSSIILMAYII